MCGERVGLTISWIILIGSIGIVEEGGVGLLTILTSGLMVIVIIGGWNKGEIGYMVGIEILLIIAFQTESLLIFYVAYEGVLIRMYLLIGKKGKRARKVRAGYLLLMYTVGGSVLMLVSILEIYMEVGSLQYGIIENEVDGRKIWERAWWGFMIGFAVKVRLYRLHLWLREAHVEARTGGSVVLAGLLLKLGTYGIWRFNEGMWKEVEVEREIIIIMGVMGVVYGSLGAMRQRDMKRVIAYSSVAHMNMVVIGLLSGSEEGEVGGLIQMVGHGLISSGLFMGVGVIYDRYHNRLISYYGGLGQLYRKLGVIMVGLMLGNMGVRGTVAFIGEVLLLMGIGKISWVWLVVVSISMVIGGGYTLWLGNRILFGNVKIGREEGEKVRENIVGKILLGLSIWFGVQARY